MVWRLFHFELFNRTPAIQRLALHLPNQHTIVYSEERAEQALNKSKNTTLTAWFVANQIYPEARAILYHNFPEFFTWNPSSSSWTPRKSGFVIGRLYSANPAEGERYYLRILLHHLAGLTSFDDILKLPNGTRADTFKAAAIALGLLEDDSEWIQAFEEAAISAFPHQLRFLFVTLLLYCEPSRPDVILTTFREDMY